MSVESCVGMVTTANLSTYEVRTITKGRAAANVAWVSSKTTGKTFRKPGNLDATWEISLYSKEDETEIPAALKAGQIITVQLGDDASSKTMIIDSSSLEVDIEAGTLVGISLSCSADAATSY